MAPKSKGRRTCSSPKVRAEQGRRFRVLYASLGFKASDVAQFLQVTERTVHNWVSGTVPVPYMAKKLLRLQLRYELPGKAWDGWCVSAGKLYTPEGFALEPHEVSWWSLLVRQARCFRQLLQENQRLRAGRATEPATSRAQRAAGLDAGRCLVTPPGSLTAETTCPYCQRARRKQRRGLRADWRLK